MSKAKAVVVVTMSIYPHTPGSAVTIEVAPAGKDTEEILAALVVEKFRELRGKRGTGVATPAVPPAQRTRRSRTVRTSPS